MRSFVMSFVSIQEAAKLVGKSTQTIYRHINSGKLSRDSNGQIQIAELTRVYGALKQHNETQKLSSNKNVNADVIDLLQKQVDKLERDLQNLKAEGQERERQAIERESRLMALLENQSSNGRQEGLFRRMFK